MFRIHHWTFMRPLRSNEAAEAKIVHDKKVLEFNLDLKKTIKTKLSKLTQHFKRL